MWEDRREQRRWQCSRRTADKGSVMSGLMFTLRSSSSWPCSRLLGLSRLWLPQLSTNNSSKMVSAAVTVSISKSKHLIYEVDTRIEIYVCERNPTGEGGLVGRCRLWNSKWNTSLCRMECCTPNSTQNTRNLRSTSISVNWHRNEHIFFCTFGIAL